MRVKGKPCGMTKVQGTMIQINVRFRGCVILASCKRLYQLNQFCSHCSFSLQFPHDIKLDNHVYLYSLLIT